MVRMAQPLVFRPDQTIVPFRMQLLVLLPSHLIHGFAQMFGDVKFVENDLA